MLGPRQRETKGVFQTMYQKGLVLVKLVGARTVKNNFGPCGDPRVGSHGAGKEKKQETRTTGGLNGKKKKTPKREEIPLKRQKTLGDKRDNRGIEKGGDQSRGQAPEGCTNTEPPRAKEKTTWPKKTETTKKKKRKMHTGKGPLFNLNKPVENGGKKMGAFQTKRTKKPKNLKKTKFEEPDPPGKDEKLANNTKSCTK